MPQKKKYIVSGEITISVHVEVEATSKKGAVDAALGAPMMSLCYQCARGSEEDEPEWRTSGEHDGVPDPDKFVVEVLDR